MVVLLVRQAGVAQMLHDRREEVRAHGEIEHHVLALRLRQTFLEAREGFVLFEFAVEVFEPLFGPAPRFFVEWRRVESACLVGGELFERLREFVAPGGRLTLAMIHADDFHAVVEQAVGRQVVERGRRRLVGSPPAPKITSVHGGAGCLPARG